MTAAAWQLGQTVRAERCALTDLLNLHTLAADLHSVVPAAALPRRGFHPALDCQWQQLARPAEPGARGCQRRLVGRARATHAGLGVWAPGLVMHLHLPPGSSVGIACSHVCGLLRCPGWWTTMRPWPPSVSCCSWASLTTCWTSPGASSSSCPASPRSLCSSRTQAAQVCACYGWSVVSCCPCFAAIYAKEPAPVTSDSSQGLGILLPACEALPGDPSWLSCH